MNQPGIGRRIALTILTAIPFAFTPAQSIAADLKVLGAGPVEHTFKELMPAFSKATGHNAEGTFDTVGVIERKLKAGERADVIILSPASIEEMTKAGTVLAGSSVEVCRGTTGLAVRAGAPVPDISTPDALKKTLDRKSTRLNS